jgi:hypothetical protein
MGPVWMGAENVTLNGIPSSDCPACSVSLYQLHYPGPLENNGTSPHMGYTAVFTFDP